jgi:hypothetical protein
MTLVDVMLALSFVCFALAIEWPAERFEGEGFEDDSVQEPS